MAHAIERDRRYARTQAMSLARIIARELQPIAFVKEPTAEGPVFANLNVSWNGRTFNLRICDIAGRED